jgi:superoxide dismutase, Fe-Mn family
MSSHRDSSPAATGVQDRTSGSDPSFGCFDATASRFVLPTLSFALDALEPVTSRQALGIHLNKHHAGYIGKANTMLDRQAKRYASAPELVADARHSNQTALFQQAAQALNHAFFWSCQYAPQTTRPTGALQDAITRSFGGFDAMVSLACTTAAARVGSGWLWLMARKHGKLVFEVTSDAETPLDRHGEHVLLVCDIWEHAYYLDHTSDRAGWVEDFFTQLVDWRFAGRRFDATAMALA